jgi:hypothetical protein
MFDSTHMPRPERIKRKKTKTGDRCHFNVYGMPDKELYEFFVYSNPKTGTYRSLSDFTICTPEGTRPLEEANLKQDHTEDNA